MRINVLALLATALFISSCSTTRDYPPHIPTKTGQTFTISNAKGEMLFDVTAPIGYWTLNDWTKEKATKTFFFNYKGPSSGMINAEIRIMYVNAEINITGESLESFKQRTTTASLERTVSNLANNVNFQSFHKPKNLVTEVRTIAGINCAYHSFLNHSGPTLDTPTIEFRGLGSAKKEEDYYCLVIRDGEPWFLGIDIVYQYSDIIRQEGLDIDFYKTIKDFDRMLKPTLESLKLYGDLKQY